MDLAPAAQALRGQAAIRAVIAGGREVEYPVHLEGRGEIQVQVVGVTMDAAEALRGQGLLSAVISSMDLAPAAEALRGQGLLSAVISSMDLAPAAQALRGQASIWAVITGDREVEYPVHLEGRGEILASGVAMILSAGVRSLAGRGAVTAGGISTALQALVDLRGQGRVTASPTAMALTDPVARLLAGRGAITITGATRNLNTPIYAAAASATSVTLPEHQAGDFLLIVALTGFASYSSVQPTLPAGWTQVRADTGGISSYGKATIGYRIAASGAEASGTWTNANTVIAVVCRGVTGIGATSYANAANVGATPLARAAATVNASSRVLQVAHAGDWYVQATDIAAPSTSPATDLLAHTNTGALTRTEVWDSGGPVGSTTVATSSQAITWSPNTDYGTRSWMTWIFELTM